MKRLGFHYTNIHQVIRRHATESGREFTSSLAKRFDQFCHRLKLKNVRCGSNEAHQSVRSGFNEKMNLLKSKDTTSNQCLQEKTSIEENKIN